MRRFWNKYNAAYLAALWLMVLVVLWGIPTWKYWLGVALFITSNISGHLEGASSAMNTGIKQED